MTKTSSAQAIAFIGTRAFASIPRPLRDLYLAAATYAGTCGATLVTGAAAGADQAAAEAALRAGERVKLVLPWPTYEVAWARTVEEAYGDRVEVVTYHRERDVEWTRSVFAYHPAANGLSRGSLMLHARNYGIVAGAKAVIAIPSSASERKPGGTWQGIRIARALGIRVFTLWTPCDRGSLRTAITAGDCA